MIYDLIAPFYDEVNADINYSEWADFFEKIIKKEYEIRPELVLDLACGTGRMTLELAKRGYDMTGIDYSPEMLDIARNVAEKAGHDVLWLCQDISEFELYGTVDFAVCCLDSINHLTDPESLEKCLSLVHNYLIADGVFVFDINARAKFESTYAQNSYVMENDGSMCVWQNDYDESTRICDFYITLFKEEKSGKYTRYDEVQSERMYTLDEIKKLLKKTDMELLGAYSDFDFTEATDDCERIYIVAKCKK